MVTYKPLLAAATHITRRAARRRIPIISSILIISLLFPVLLYLLLGNILANDPRLVPHAFRNAQNVLFITAHPDDSVLYFGPSILQSLGRKNVNRYMLVLSSGGSYSPIHLENVHFSCRIRIQQTNTRQATSKQKPPASNTPSPQKTASSSKTRISTRIRIGTTTSSNASSNATSKNGRSISSSPSTLPDSPTRITRP